MPPCAGGGIERLRSSDGLGGDVTAAQQAGETPNDGVSGRRGDDYLVSDAEKEAFRRDGYVHLRGVLSEDELAGIEAVYDRFLRGEIAVPARTSTT